MYMVSIYLCRYRVREDFFFVILDYFENCIFIFSCWLVDDIYLVVENDIRLLFDIFRRLGFKYSGVGFFVKDFIRFEWVWIYVGCWINSVFYGYFFVDY